MARDYSYRGDESDGMYSGPDEIEIEYEIAKEFEDFKEQTYFNNRGKLEKLNKLLKANRCKEYQSAIERFEAERAEFLKQTDIFRKYQIECVNREFVKAKEDIDVDIAKKKKEAYSTILNSLNEEKKTLEEERNSNELNTEAVEVKASNTRKSQRQIQSTTTTTTATNGKGKNKRRNAGPTGPRWNLKLKETDILQDTSAMKNVKDKKGSSTRRR